jgi:hypothetical protein
LREFDQIQFYEVDQAEFDRCYEDFKTGRFCFEVEETTFDPAAYKVFLDSIEQETKEFVARRNAANLVSGDEETRLLEAWHAEQAERGADDRSGDDVAERAIDGKLRGVSSRYSHILSVSAYGTAFFRVSVQIETFT